jgi:streptogramin lyase
MWSARTGVRVVVLLTALAAVWATSVVEAAPIGMLKQFKIPTANSGPRGITQGSDGNVWFTEGNARNIGRATPKGAITEFSVAAMCNCFPNGDITQGPNNVLYFTTDDNTLGRITTSGQVVLPAAVNPSLSAANGEGIAAHGTDVWYAGFNTNSIWRFNTLTSAFTEFVPPTAGSDPYDVAVDASGNVWFTEQLGQIGRIDGATINMAHPVITERAIPNFPRQITIATDGSVWVTERFSNPSTNPPHVGRLDPTTNVFTEFPLPAGSGPEGIAAAPDGSVWVTESDSGSTVRLTAAGGIVAQGPTVAGSQPFGITVAPNGNPWWAELSANKIAELILR